MKLRTGKPVWLAQPPRALRRSRCGARTECDVAVIGAGVTGVLIASALLEAGLSVVMFDQRDAGLGSTAASTGLLLYQPDLLMREIARRHGYAAARRAYWLGVEAIRDLRRLVRRYGIKCGWRSRRTLYVASTASDVPKLRREYADLRRARLAVRFLSRDELQHRYGLASPAALVAPGAAEVNALALTRGVLRRCLGNPRLDWRPHTRVRSVRPVGDGVVVRAAGANVRARFAIVATGYETRGFVETPLVRMHSTYVIASSPQPPSRLRRLRCLIWETARPYFYLRTTADRRIVFGGLDDACRIPSCRARNLGAKARALQRLFAQRFPERAFEPAYAWTGAFADTTDGLPCIGPVRRGSRVLFALGYGGNGITFSQIAARILRDHCCGRTNRDARIFAFDRGGRRSRRRR